jgi:hypothetical protein
LKRNYTWGYANKKKLNTDGVVWGYKKTLYVVRKIKYIYIYIYLFVYAIYLIYFRRTL